MTRKYQTNRTVEIYLDGKTLEIEANIEFTIAHPAPAQGPSYSSGGQPAEGGHCEDIWCKGIKLPGYAKDFTAECPEWLSEWIVENTDGDRLFAEAIDEDRHDREQAADDRYEMAREDVSRF